jgi:hypothetical protein
MVVITGVNELVDKATRNTVIPMRSDETNPPYQANFYIF